jgi:hypothetical protein
VAIGTQLCGGPAQLRAGPLSAVLHGGHGHSPQPRRRPPEPACEWVHNR